MKRVSLILFMFFLLSGLLFAGEVSQFVNLGFSPDSRTFVFGQFGVNRNTSAPFASLFVVDVERNDFVRNGTFRSTEQDPVSVGQNGSGALYNLIHQAAPIIQQQRVNHSLQGRLVYLFINGQEPRSRITFRDFNNSNHYEINLVQQSRGSGETQSAAFHLRVSATTSAGRVVQQTIGLPDFFRPGISRYLIRQVLLSPDERSLVVVVERIAQTPQGERIDFMVETAKLF